MLLENTLGWQPSAQEICLRRSDDPAKQVTPSAANARTAVGLEEDSALAEACRTGSLSAYEQLYQKHGARLKSIALNLLGNVHDAEDAVQEAFLKVHRGIRSFKGQSAFSTWIYRILLNSCYDLRRKKQRRQEHPNRTWSHKGPLRRRRLPPITPCGWRSKPVWLDSVPITGMCFYCSRWRVSAIRKLRPCSAFLKRRRKTCCIRPSGSFAACCQNRKSL